MFQTATTWSASPGFLFDSNYQSTDQEAAIQIPHAEKLKSILSNISRQRIISSDILLPSQDVASETVQSVESEFDVSHEILEYENIVKLAPRERYTIILNVISVRKAKPHVVDPTQE
ncbi:MAG: hypothetical protein ACOYY3_08810 [Chloroflexota bacterium]